jgi:hypothetical protein
VQPTEEVAVGRGRGAARAQLAGAVARPLRGVGGCGRPGPWRGWPWPGRYVARPARARLRQQLAGGKTKYKGVECKGKTQICM